MKTFSRIRTPVGNNVKMADGIEMAQEMIVIKVVDAKGTVKGVDQIKH